VLPDLRNRGNLDPRRTDQWAAGARADFWVASGHASAVAVPLIVMISVQSPLRDQAKSARYDVHWVFTPMFPRSNEVAATRSTQLFGLRGVERDTSLIVVARAVGATMGST
jgi:hypothetical protein